MPWKSRNRHRRVWRETAHPDPELVETMLSRIRVSASEIVIETVDQKGKNDQPNKKGTETMSEEYTENMDEEYTITEPLSITMPWQAYASKLATLFNPDPAITVSEVKRSQLSDYNYYLTICVNNHKKYMALNELLDHEVTFGQVKMQIVIIDIESQDAEIASRIGKYNILFRGNPLFDSLYCVADQTGTEHGYFQFKPEVVQYFNDDCLDLNGLRSCLPEQIATEVFNKESWVTGVNFCTAKIVKPEEDRNGEAAESSGQ